MLPRHLDPAFLIQAYASGIFPMGDPQDGKISWYAPDPRAILEHHDLVISRSLCATIRQKRFEVRIDTAFEAVMRQCAAPRKETPETWITEEFIWAYTVLYNQGYAHSVEAWQGGELVGGLYGVSIGGAFMGESMFSRRSDASKVCLVALVDRLRKQRFTLHDVQFLTPHLQRLGARNITYSNYRQRLQLAVEQDCTF